MTGSYCLQNYYYILHSIAASKIVHKTMLKKHYMRMVLCHLLHCMDDKKQV